MKKRAEQKKVDSKIKTPVNLRFVHRDSVTELEDEFPFESVMDFLPGTLQDEVCLQDCCCSCLNTDFRTIK
jgi:hypothetical protein